MGCPSCGAENPPTNKFCGECGAALARVCGGCGTRNPPTNRFCGECGGRLAPGAETSAAAADVSSPSPHSYTPRHLAEKILASRAALQGERKQVTVLFADVVGSTELIQDLDPEDARSLLEPAVSAMLEAVHRYEGTVSRVIGDGIMALFGAPLAHEDHAARACYAALTMQEAIRRYGDTIRLRDGGHLLARVGLHSGEVVVGSISNDLHVEYTAIGATTHLAARMEQLAVPGTIQLTGETLRLAEGLIEVRSLGRISVKGLAEPVAAFELIGAGPTRRRFQAAATRWLTPFVGRLEELDALQRALDLAASRRGQVVAPVGEPGVGKSRLFYEFVHSHRTEGWTVLESGSVSYGKATSYLPVIDLVKSYCRIESQDDVRTIREKVTGKLVTLDPSLAAILPPVLALLDVPVDPPANSGTAPSEARGAAVWASLDPSERRRATLDGLRRLLLRQSQEQPLLLLFEDLHWIDSETQALLDSLVEALPTARILLLANYRPEYTHTWGNKSYYTQLRLDPLGAAGVDELLTALVGTSSTVQPLQALLVTRTQGNPFFLEESVRELVETGLLIGEPGAYRLTRTIEEVRVPPTVQVMLAARIDRLSATEKRLLQMAAVIGKDVPFRLLQAIAEMTEADLHADLSRLQAAELLYPVSLFPELELTFKHALTQEVAYGGLLQERRKTVHAQIVEAIEALHSGRLDEHVERLAHHALRAEWWERAGVYCQEAGERAMARSAHRAAAAWFEQALTVLAHGPEDRAILTQGIDLRLRLRNALTPVGATDVAFRHLLEAQAIAERLGDGYRLALIACQATHVLVRLGQSDSAVASGERALAAAQELGDAALEVMTHVHLCHAYADRGEYRQALDGLRQSVAHLEAGLAPAELHARSNAVSKPEAHACASLSAYLGDVGDFAEGTMYGDRAVMLAEQADHPYTLCLALFRLGHLQVVRGHVPAAIASLERSLTLSEIWDFPPLFPMIAARLGAAYTVAGRTAEGLTMLRRAVDRANAIQNRSEEVIYGVWQAAGYLADGQIDVAGELARRALDLATARGQRSHVARARCLIGQIAACDDPPDVRRSEPSFQEALTLAEELGMRPLQAHCHLGLGKLYRRTGRLDEARAELATAVAMLREMGMAFWLPEAEAKLAEV